MHAAVSLALTWCLALGPAPVGDAPADEASEASEEGELAEPAEAEADEVEAEVDEPAEVEADEVEDEVEADEVEDEVEADEVEDELDAGADAAEAEADEVEAEADEVEAEPIASPAPALVDATPAAPAAPVVRDGLGCTGKSCRRMTITGIAVGILGLGGVGAGIGLLLSPDRVIPEEPIFVTSTRPAGLVTVTLGVGVTLTCVLMLVAAHKGQRAAPKLAVTASGFRF